MSSLPIVEVIITTRPEVEAMDEEVMVVTMIEILLEDPQPRHKPPTHPTMGNPTILDRVHNSLHKTTAETLVNMQRITTETAEITTATIGKLRLNIRIQVRKSLVLVPDPPVSMIRRCLLPSLRWSNRGLPRFSLSLDTSLVSSQLLVNLILDLRRRNMLVEVDLFPINITTLTPGTCRRRSRAKSSCPPTNEAVEVVVATAVEVEMTPWEDTTQFHEEEDMLELGSEVLRRGTRPTSITDSRDTTPELDWFKEPSLSEPEKLQLSNLLNHSLRSQIFT